MPDGTKRKSISIRDQSLVMCQLSAGQVKPLHLLLSEPVSQEELKMREMVSKKTKQMTLRQQQGVNQNSELPRPRKHNSKKLKRVKL